MEHAKKIFGLALLCVIPAMLAAQVPVHINSGDPAFPFPQFLPYVHAGGDTLHNLGTRNADGVTHAEMEKNIREAYQIMMNRADHQADVLNGTQYIKYRSNPDCSEGTGYAMLAAAMMADKVTFDGLWLYTHDYAMNKVTRYRDGQPSSPGYNYSVLPGWQNAAGGNSAADGDYDIALALMIAHMHWGDDMGIRDSRGNMISYRDDFIKVARGLSDTVIFKTNGNLLSGTIGLDGYFKGGDSWSELTGWAGNQANLASLPFGGLASLRVEQPGPTMQHIDYTAPAYFRQFADYLSGLDSARYAWNIFQFRRAEASSDWLIGKLIAQNPRNIPVAGWVEMAQGAEPVFTTFSDGEDFRAAWRTVLSHVWHGNPAYSWDPVKNIIVPNRPNTHLKDAGERMARFMWDRRQAPWSQSECEKIIGEGRWWGPSMLKYHYSPQGEALGVYPLNWMHGTGSPSAVVSQDHNLMAEMYRQLELEWDVEEPGDRYLTSTPFYFHGFFRMLGLMVLSGNHHAPLNMRNRQANMKVYLDVDRTYAFEEDTITYTVDYRNYGAADAQGVVISSRLHNDMVVVSSTGGGSYDPATNTVSWNIGAVPGYKSSMGANPTETAGRVSFKVIIPYANLKRYETQARITCANGPGWVSNEFPNKVSSIMKRNGVDIARRALKIDYSVYRDTVNPGMEATYTIKFENSAEAGWLNGGRPGVNFTYAHSGTPETGPSHTFMLRAFNDAHEAYIDYGNYRVSYFMFDNNYSGIGGQTGWQAPIDIFYPMNPPGLKERAESALFHEMITPGQDAHGRWNQRLIMQISPTQSDTNWVTMAAPSQFLINYHGLTQRVHRGTAEPFKAVWRMNVNYVNRNWGQDWSFNPNVAADVGNDALANWGYPVSPDFSGSYDPDYKGVPVTAVHRKLCGTPPSHVVENVLVEEFDGYTWRRVFGNGPVPGREVTNVVIRDTIPAGVTFKGFVGPPPLGAAPRISGNIITWEIDKLLVGEGGTIRYTVTADTPSTFTDRRIRGRAWIEGDRESPTFDDAFLLVTRDSLPPPPPAATTMYKTADRELYGPQDTIRYTIAYTNTHGYTEASTSASQWEGSGVSLSGDGRTIRLGDSNVSMRFTPSLGTNVTLMGTIRPVQYENEFSIVVRESGSNRVEVTFKQEWEGVLVKVTSNGLQIDTGIDAIPVAKYQTPDGVVMDYKIAVQGENMSLWIGDTSAYHPLAVIAGVPEREGLAGVRYTSAGYGSASITGWTVRSERAYVTAIRDTIPANIHIIESSITGQINTGALAPRTLTASLAGNVITWPVNDWLGGNDSLTVAWKAVVDTQKTNSIINTAYADLRGYPTDSIGAQVRSRYSDAPDIPDDPDDPDDPDIPDDPLLGLVVRATPRGGLFAGSIDVTLSSQSGTEIWYTINGMIPDRASPAARRYSGQPITFTATTTLRAIAYMDGYEPSDVITHTYELIETIPVQTAIFYDDVGDGLAHGVKIVLAAPRVRELNEELIRKHINLIGFDGMPGVESVTFSGDTVTIRFVSGLEADPNAYLIIRDPDLSSGSGYDAVHGYLAGASVKIVDGVPPVITEAIYYPSVQDDKPTPVAGDTLAVTFNKYAQFLTTFGRMSPFVFTRGGLTYELGLEYIRRDMLTVYFVVLDITMITGGLTDMPEDGDMVRINAAGGEVSNLYGYPQQNTNNTAVPLRIRYPELDYIIRIGPSPFRPHGESLRMSISIEPFLPSAFEALNPDVRIFDRMGNVVATTEIGKNLKTERDAAGRSYVILWNGTNRMGRRVGSGIYVVNISIKDQDGKVKTVRQKIYVRAGMR